MKAIWILNHYAQEPGGPGGTRHFSLAKWLLQRGWRASIIASSIELNTGRQRLAQGESFRLEVFDGVPFLWLRCNRYEGNGIGRMINMILYSAQAIRPGHTRILDRPHAIIGSSVHPLAAWAGAVLARRYGVPFIFEVRDLWPQTLVDLGRIPPSGFMTNRLYALENRLYRRAAKIIILPPQAADYIEPLGIDRDKIVWIPNGVDLSDFPCYQLPSGNVFTVMYVGAHGAANGLDNLLRSMEILENRSRSRNIRLRLVGDGPYKMHLKELAARLELKNVIFEPPVAKMSIPSIMAEADGFIFNLVDTPVFKYGISSNKLFDYMAAGRPIIFCCKSPNNPVEEAKAGLTVAPDNPWALAEAIERLAALSLADRAEMGRSARKYVEEQHSYQNLSLRLASLLEELVKNKPPGWCEQKGSEN